MSPFIPTISEVLIAFAGSSVCQIALPPLYEQPSNCRVVQLEDIARLRGLAGEFRIDDAARHAVGEPIEFPAFLVYLRVTMNLHGCRDVPEEGALRLIGNIHNLYKVDFSSSNVRGLGGIEEAAPSLMVLDVSNTGIDALCKSLTRLIRLEELNIARTRVDAEDLGFLAELPLKVLSISHTNVSTVCLLGASLATLERLDLSHTQISDVASLSKATRLKFLSIGGTRVLDVAALATCVSLTNLIWDNVQPQSDDKGYGGIMLRTDGIGNISSLTRLNLGHSCVDDIDSLNKLSNLRALSLEDTSVWDLSPLSSCTSLQELNLQCTPISECTALAGLHNMEYLLLSGTQVQDSDAAACSSNSKHLG